MSNIAQYKAIRDCYQSKKDNSTKRNIPFDMSFETFAALKRHTHCQYSGLPFDDEHGFSFERIDNNVGYLDGNVIAVSRVINSARSSYDVESLAAHINHLFAVLEKYQNYKTNPVQYNDTRKPIIKAKQMGRWNSLVSQYNAAHRAVERRLRLIAEGDVLLSKINKTTPNANQRCKNRINMNTKLRQALTKDRNKLSNIGTQLINFYKAQKTTVEMKGQVNTYYDEILKREKGNPEQIKDKIQAVLKNIEYSQYALMGLMRFSDLSSHDKMCVKLGIPLDSSADKVKHIMEYRNVCFDV